MFVKNSDIPGFETSEMLIAQVFVGLTDIHLIRTPGDSDIANLTLHLERILPHR